MTQPLADTNLQAAIETRFQCHRCGNCCKGNGAVTIKMNEAERMADHLGISRGVFLKRYTRTVVPGQWWLKDIKNEEQWCIFLEQDDDGLYRCRVNEAKPDQCASFPEKWRNSDSLTDCAGLRALMAGLEAESANGSKA